LRKSMFAPFPADGRRAAATFAGPGARGAHVLGPHQNFLACGKREKRKQGRLEIRNLFRGSEQKLFPNIRPARDHVRARPRGGNTTIRRLGGAGQGAGERWAGEKKRRAWEGFRPVGEGHCTGFSGHGKLAARMERFTNRPMAAVSEPRTLGGPPRPAGPRGRQNQTALWRDRSAKPGAASGQAKLRRAHFHVC